MNGPSEAFATVVTVVGVFVAVTNAALAFVLGRRSRIYHQRYIEYNKRKAEALDRMDRVRKRMNQ